MADNKTVAQEDPVLGLDGTELVRVVQGGDSMRATADQYPKIRLAADWFDDVNTNFQGTIDTTAAPYSGNSEPGQSTICANPATAADSGIWVLGTHADPAAVPVTHRSDSVIGSVWRTGELAVQFDVGGEFPVLYRLKIQTDTDDLAQGVLDGATTYLVFGLVLSGVGVFTRGTFTEGIVDNDFLTFVDMYPKVVVHETSGYFGGNNGLANLFDATAGNLLMNLDGADVTVPAPGRGGLVFCKRIDSSGNSVIVTVPAGTFLEGVDAGTITLSPLESAIFQSDAVSKWWRI